MAFRYMNPGVVALLDSDCVSTQVSSTKYSKSGTAFTQTKNDSGVTLPKFSEGDDFWARFDLYIPSESYVREIYCLVPRNICSGILLRISQSTTPVTVYFYESSTSTTSWLTNFTLEASGVKLDEINSIVFHVVYGTSKTGALELFINGVKFSKSGLNISYVSSYNSKLKLWCTRSTVYFSNIIFSDEEISPRERVVSLPVSGTETDMTLDESGIYVSDAANQKILQAFDLATLIETFGASSAVTGIEIVGNPAYRTGTGITSLIGLEKAGGIISEHGTCALKEDTTAFVTDGWMTENLTVRDLENMQFGWKVGR